MIGTPLRVCDVSHYPGREQISANMSEKLAIRKMRCHVVTDRATTDRQGLWVTDGWTGRGKSSRVPFNTQ